MQPTRRRRRDGTVARSHYTKYRGRETKTPSEDSKTAAFGESLRKGFHQPSFKSWLLNHLWVLISSLGQLKRTPFATLMTSAVIGVALALPTGLHVLLNNVQQLAGNWDGGVQISLFLKEGVTEQNAQSLLKQLVKRPDIDHIDYISQSQALAEFQQYSGLGDVLNLLNENPLPSVLVVYPKNSHPRPKESEKLLASLRLLPEVDIAQFDMQWLKRLNAFLEIGERGLWLITSLLTLAILVIIGNTIRLTVYNRRQEIEVTKLIGATDGFIRRPFLYCGVWYGLFGGIIAWILVFSFLWALSEPVKTLSVLYNSDFRLHGWDSGVLLIPLVAGILLGLIGSWISVGRHLTAIEPN